MANRKPRRATNTGQGSTISKPIYRMPRKKKTKLAKAKEALTTIFNKYIRENKVDPERGRVCCVVCGTTENLQCGHLFTSRDLSTRWDEDNCWPNCPGCNHKHENDPYPYNRWFIRNFGMEAYDNLYAKHKTVRQYRIWEIEELIETYKKKVEELGGWK